MAKVIKRVEAHHEVRGVEDRGRAYGGCPESVVIGCDCREKLTLTASRTTCGRCGAGHAAIAEEVLDPRPGDKVDHPGRSLDPYCAPTRGT